MPRNVIVMRKLSSLVALAGYDPSGMLHGPTSVAALVGPFIFTLTSP